jgi:hypothetical protein
VWRAGLRVVVGMAKENDSEFEVLAVTICSQVDMTVAAMEFYDQSKSVNVERFPSR